MDEKKKFESGETPGMLNDPFGIKQKTPEEIAAITMPKKKFIAGQTPGSLKDPFNRSKGKNKTKLPAKPQHQPTVRHLVQRPVQLPPPEPYWYRISKYMFDDVRVRKNLSNEQIEWIKKLAEIIPDILVKVPPFSQVSTEDAEVAILLESIENIQNIVETKSASFDPVRQWNKTFAQLSKKQRAIFWTELSKNVLQRLGIE